MITIKDTTTVNEKISKAWIFSTGEERCFPFNVEHYRFVPEAEANGDYSPELMRGGVRMLRLGNHIACNIHKVDKESIYKIISFMRKRLLTKDEVIIIQVENNNMPIEFESFKHLCQYYNLNFNN